MKKYFTRPLVQIISGFILGFGCCLVWVYSSNPLQERKLPESQKQYSPPLLSLNRKKTSNKTDGVPSQEIIKEVFPDDNSRLKTSTDQLVGKVIDWPAKGLDQAKMQVLVAEWAKDSPLEALAFAKENKRDEVIYMILAQAGESGQLEVLDWIHANQSRAEFPYWLSSYYQGMALTEPSFALDQALNESVSESVRDNLITGVVDEWAIQDIDAVLEWLEQQEKTPLTRDLINLATAKYIDQRPWEAAATLPEDQGAGAQAQHISVLADALSKQDIPASLDWADSLEPGVKREALASILGNWASQGGGEEVLSYALDSKNNLGNTEAMRSVIISLADRSTDILLKRYSELAPEDQIFAVERLANSLSGQKRKDWLSTLPVNHRDRAYTQVISQRLVSDPEGAFSYAESINNPENRIYYATEAATSMARIDRDRARATVFSSSAFSDAEKTKILESLN